MDDVGELAGVGQDRSVLRAPETLLEAAALLLGPLDVVLLHRHRVGDLLLPDPFERGREVAHPGRLGVIRVVREDIEDPPADDLLAPGHRRLEVGVACRDDPEVRIEDEIEARGGLEERAEINLR